MRCTVAHQGYEGVVNEERVVALVEVALAARQDLQTRVKGTLTQHLTEENRRDERGRDSQRGKEVKTKNTMGNIVQCTTAILEWQSLNGMGYSFVQLMLPCPSLSSACRPSSPRTACSCSWHATSASRAAPV